MALRIMYVSNKNIASFLTFGITGYSDYLILLFLGKILSFI